MTKVSQQRDIWRGRHLLRRPGFLWLDSLKYKNGKWLFFASPKEQERFYVRCRHLFILRFLRAKPSNNRYILRPVSFGKATSYPYHYCLEACPSPFGWKNWTRVHSVTIWSRQKKGGKNFLSQKSRRKASFHPIIPIGNKGILCSVRSKKTVFLSVDPEGFFFLLRDFEYEFISVLYWMEK